MHGSCAILRHPVADDAVSENAVIAFAGLNRGTPDDAGDLDLAVHHLACFVSAILRCDLRQKQLPTRHLHGRGLEVRKRRQSSVLILGQLLLHRRVRLDVDGHVHGHISRVAECYRLKGLVGSQHIVAIDVKELHEASSHLHSNLSRMRSELVQRGACECLRGKAVNAVEDSCVLQHAQIHDGVSEDRDASLLRHKRRRCVAFRRRAHAEWQVGDGEARIRRHVHP
mmetsp:Transcript_28573/g.80541  ORF Transcript_28573/g.80541 Transcript_28573/m.80541 type:complete len:226 (+) Transcript_28573:1306-1983(+)